MKIRVADEQFGGPRLIPTVPGGSSRPYKTSSVIKTKFSTLLHNKPFCQITAEITTSMLGMTVLTVGMDPRPLT